MRVARSRSQAKRQRHGNCGKIFILMNKFSQHQINCFDSFFECVFRMSSCKGSWWNAEIAERFRPCAKVPKFLLLRTQSAKLWTAVGAEAMMSYLASLPSTKTLTRYPKNIIYTTNKQMQIHFCVNVFFVGSDYCIWCQRHALEAGPEWFSIKQLPDC